MTAKWPPGGAGWSGGIATVAARFTVQAPAEVVAERITPAVGTVEPVDERTCVLEAGADAIETIAVYIGLLGIDFTVDGPPELIAKLRELPRYERATRQSRPGASGPA